MIERLQAPEASALRSAVGVASLAHALEEVLLNALQAGAARVAAEVDAAALALAVDDDGPGLPEERLHLVDASGASSLGALCACAVVDVATRPAGGFLTLHRAVAGGAVVRHGLAAPADQRARRGTRVRVRDLFFNLPVRRRAERAGGPAAGLERCRAAAERLALAHPAAALELRAAGRGAPLLAARAGRCPRAAAAAFLAPPGEGVMVPVASPPGAGAGALQVEGYALLPPWGAPGGGRQLLVLDGRPVRAPELAAAVDGLFQKVRARCARAAWAAGPELQRVEGAANARPAYVLRLAAVRGAYELVRDAGAVAAVFADAAAAAAAVEDAVAAAWAPALTAAALDDLERRRAAAAAAAAPPPPAAEELRRPGSAPAAVMGGLVPVSAEAAAAAAERGRRRRGAPAGGRRRALTAGATLASKSVSFAATPSVDGDAAAEAAAAVAAAEAPAAKRPRLQLPSLPEGSRDLAGPAHKPPPLPPPQQQRYAAGGWGNRPPPQQKPAAVAAGGGALPDWHRTKAPSAAATPEPPRAPPAPAAAAPAAAQGRPAAAAPGPRAGPLDVLLSTWRNPVWAPPACDSVLSLERLAGAAFCPLAPPALTRGQLAVARALPQVDAKFVPVVVPPEEGSAGGAVLALLDQHAAHERVLLERLRPLVVAPGGSGAPGRGVGSAPLAAPRPLGLCAAEAAALDAHAAAAAAWGWRWRGGHLTAVPTVLGAALTPTDLRLFLAAAAAAGGAPPPPPGALRVLASKACRSAIMFGDALAPAECQALADELGAAAMPFQCAHGRPTTAALVDLGALAGALRLVAGAAAGDEEERRTRGLVGIRDRLVRALADA